MGCDFRFVHVADVHLGSRFKEVSARDPDEGRRMRESVFTALDRIVDGTRDRTDFMVIAGDVYDEAFMTPRTRLRFSEAMSRYGKPVFMVKGNHDFGDAWEDSVPYPPNVHLFPVEPKTYSMTINGRKVEVTGVSYGQWHTTDNLAVKLRGSPDSYTIGVVHCSVREVAESEEYAPCSVHDLTGRNVDYWALGHVHKRTVVREKDPVIVYPGNVQGRNPRESGEKGCYVATVTGDETEIEFMPAQDILWEDATLDITGSKDLGELLRGADLRKGSITSITFTGRGPLNSVIRADPEGVAEQLSSMNRCVVRVDAVDTAPEIDVELLRGGGTLMSEILRTAESMGATSDKDLTDMLCRGPAADVRDVVEDLASKGKLKEMLAEAELSVLTRLSEGSQ